MRIIMTRIAKQQERRNMCPRKRKASFDKKTGPKKDNLEKGFKEHTNGIELDLNAFIGKIK